MGFSSSSNKLTVSTISAASGFVIVFSSRGDCVSVSSVEACGLSLLSVSTVVVIICSFFLVVSIEIVVSKLFCGVCGVGADTVVVVVIEGSTPTSASIWSKSKSSSSSNNPVAVVFLAVLLSPASPPETVELISEKDESSLAPAATPFFPV